MRPTLFSPGAAASLDVETGFWMRDPGDDVHGTSEDFVERFKHLRERTHENLHWRQLRGTSLGVMLGHLVFLRNRIVPQACAVPGTLARIQACLRRGEPVVSPEEYDTEALAWDFDGIADGPSKARWVAYDKLFQNLMKSPNPCGDLANPRRLKSFVDDFAREFGQLRRHPLPFGDIKVDADPLAAVSMNITDAEMARFFADEDRPNLVELLEFSAVLNELGHTYVSGVIVDDLVGADTPSARSYRETTLGPSGAALGERLEALQGTAYLRALPYVSKILGTDLDLSERWLRTFMAVGACIDIALNPALPPASASRFGVYLVLGDFDAVGRFGLILSKNVERVLAGDFEISLEGAAALRADLARAAGLTWTDERPTVSLPDSLYAEYLASFDREGSVRQPWAGGSAGLFLMNALVYEGFLRLKQEFKLGYLSDDVFGFGARLEGERLRISHVLNEPEIHVAFGHVLKHLNPIAQLHEQDGVVDFGAGQGWHPETCFLVLKFTLVLDATYDIMLHGRVSFLRQTEATLSPNLVVLKEMVDTYFGA